MTHRSDHAQACRPSGERADQPSQGSRLAERSAPQSDPGLRPSRASVASSRAFATSSRCATSFLVADLRARAARVHRQAGTTSGLEHLCKTKCIMNRGPRLGVIEVGVERDLSLACTASQCGPGTETLLAVFATIFARCAVESQIEQRQPQRDQRRDAERQLASLQCYPSFHCQSPALRMS